MEASKSGIPTTSKNCCGYSEMALLEREICFDCG